VTGRGHYRDPYIPVEHLDKHGVGALADAMVHEIREGFGDAGIRPGIIGEVGSNHKLISAREEGVSEVSGVW
jgi:predicted metal-dependent phosphotriesterase family hydrolase